MRTKNVRNITTTITDQQYDLCVKHGWKWSQLIKEGIGAMVNPSILQDEIKDLKFKLSNLEKAQEYRRKLEKSREENKKTMSIMGFNN